MPARSTTWLRPNKFGAGRNRGPGYVLTNLGNRYLMLESPRDTNSPSVMSSNRERGNPFLKGV